MHSSEIIALNSGPAEVTKILGNYIDRERPVCEFFLPHEISISEILNLQPYSIGRVSWNVGRLEFITVARNVLT